MGGAVSTCKPATASATAQVTIQVPRTLHRPFSPRQTNGPCLESPERRGAEGET